MNETVFICGIDAVKEKNMHQIRGLRRSGYRFVVLTTDSTGASSKVVADDPDVLLYKASGPRVVLSMLACTVRILWRYRPSIVEIYPHSHFSFIASLICKLVRIPTLIIARGEELKYVQRGMPLLRRMFFRGCYALADAVAYKELYMPEMLDKMRKRVRWHLPNAIQLPDVQARAGRKGCTFLYMNSMKPFRHPELCLDAFLRVCEKWSLNASSDIRLLIVGMSSSVSSSEVREKEGRLRRMLEGRDVPVELHQWTNDPAKYLRQADVFLLPSDVVYVNYALLEAMGRGMPAIVQRAPGVEKLVENGREGYVEDNDVSDWESSMASIVEDREMRLCMGRAARERVAREFSYDAYLAKYAKIYEYLLNRCDRCPPEHS